MIARRIFNVPATGWRHPFWEVERMARQMDQLTNAMFGRSGYPLFAGIRFPAVNISETGDKYVVRAELPGIKADDVDLNISGRNLTISGERKFAPECDGVKYHHKEREVGSFKRVVGLPGEIDAEGVNAKMVDGVLTVEIPKSETAKPKQITIH